MVIVIRFFQRSTAKHAMCLAAYSCLFKDSTSYTLLLVFKILFGGSYKKVIYRLLK